MSRNLLRRIVAAGAIALLPAAALAEVSVRLDGQGRVKKVFYLTRGKGDRAVIWGQVRKHLPIELMLNPLGDNLGDLPPVIARHPETGLPWVVWSMNVANQKRIAFSTWIGSEWTAPARVVRTIDPMGHDQLDPFLAFDAAGRPYLVWWVDAPVAQVFFSTLTNGVWTPPLRLSDPSVDSRRPSVALAGLDAAVSYDTPAGPMVEVLGTVSLVQSANGLMDSPIPPGNEPQPGDSGGDDTPSDQRIKK